MNAQATLSSPDIYFTSAISHEVPDAKAHEVLQVGDFVNNKIDLQAFGDGLNRIWFVAIIMEPEDRIYTNKIVFHRKNKALEVFWRMDYERVMAASLIEFKAYLSIFLIDVLTEALQKKKIKNFDSEQFLNQLDKELNSDPTE